jgi:hypothetical protein
MARFRRPPFDPARIAAKLRPLIQTAPRNTQLEMVFGAEVAPLELAETIEMWHLDEEQAMKARQLGDGAMRIARWHHQITAHGKPVAHATSVERNADAEVASVTHSDALARQVDAAIALIDQDRRLDDVVEARFLSVPSFHVDALWLVGPGVGGIVVLPGVSADRAEERIGIFDLTIMGEENFLSRVRRAGPVTGFAIGLQNR